MDKHIIHSTAYDGTQYEVRIPRRCDMLKDKNMFEFSYSISDLDPESPTYQRDLDDRHRRVVNHFKDHITFTFNFSNSKTSKRMR